MMENKSENNEGIDNENSGIARQNIFAFAIWLFFVVK